MSWQDWTLRLQSEGMRLLIGLASMIAADVLFLEAVRAQSLPRPLDLFEVHRSIDSQQDSRILRLKDPRSGETLTSTFDPWGNLLTQERASPAGRRKESWEFSSSPPRTRHRLHEAPFSYRELEVGESTISIYENGVVRVVDRNHSTTVCSEPSLPESLVAEIQKRLPRVADAASLHRFATQEGYLDGESILTGCDPYPEGKARLQAELRSALTQGVSCLMRHGSQSRMDAARLMAILDRDYGRPLTVRCRNSRQMLPNVVAQARIWGMEGFPGIDINLDHPALKKAKGEDRVEFLFHEFAHLLGSVHGADFDLPYVAQRCCFPDGPKELGLQSTACTLLERRPDWRSTEYLKAFIDLFPYDTRSGDPAASANALWGAIAPDLLPAAADSRARETPHQARASVIHQALSARFARQALPRGSLRLVESMAVLHSVADDLSAAQLYDLQERIRNYQSVWLPPLDGNRSSVYSMGPTPDGQFEGAYRLGALLRPIRRGELSRLPALWAYFKEGRMRDCADASHRYLLRELGHVMTAAAPTVAYFESWNQDPNLRPILREIGDYFETRSYCPER